MTLVNNKMFIIIDSIVNIKVVSGEVALVDTDYDVDEAPNAIFKFLNNVKVNNIVVVMKGLTSQTHSYNGRKIGNTYYNCEDLSFVERLFKDCKSDTDSTLSICNLYEKIPKDVISIDSYKFIAIISYIKDNMVQSMMSNIAYCQDYCSKINKNNNIGPIELFNWDSVAYLNSLTPSVLLASSSVGAKEVIVKQSETPSAKSAKVPGLNIDKLLEDQIEHDILEEYSPKVTKKTSMLSGIFCIMGILVVTLSILISLANLHSVTTALVDLANIPKSAETLRTKQEFLEEVKDYTFYYSTNIKDLNNIKDVLVTSSEIDGVSVNQVYIYSDIFSINYNISQDVNVEDLIAIVSEVGSVKNYRISEDSDKVEDKNHTLYVTFDLLKLDLNHTH